MRPNGGPGRSPLRAKAVPAGDLREATPSPAGPEPFAVRPLSPSDFPDLISRDWSPIVGERDTVYLFLVRDHAELSRVAEAEGSPPLGYLVAARSADGESAFIFHVHVSEGRRSAGVGTALVRDFEEGARALGVRLAWFLAARGSVAFYERLGYAPDPGALPPDLARYVREAKHSIVMSKRLGRTGQAGRGDDQEPSGDKCFSSGPQVST